MNMARGGNNHSNLGPFDWEDLENEIAGDRSPEEQMNADIIRQQMQAIDMKQTLKAMDEEDAAILAEIREAKDERMSDRMREARALREYYKPGHTFIDSLHGKWEVVTAKQMAPHCGFATLINPPLHWHMNGMGATIYHTYHGRSAYPEAIAGHAEAVEWVESDLIPTLESDD